MSSIQDIFELGVYLTTAVKGGRQDYGIKAGPIRECSRILEEEIKLFTKVQAFLLMGDVAIRGMNYIAKWNGEERVIPPGSRYKIRGREFYYRGRRRYYPICRQGRVSS